MSFLNNLKQTLPSRIEAARKLSVSNSVSRAVEMQFRYLGDNQMIWYSKDREELLKKGFLDNHAIFTIQDWKAQKVASAPPLLYEVKDQKSYKKYRHMSKNTTYDGFMRAQDFKLKALVEIEDSQILKVLNRPNPMMGWFEFAYGYTVYKDIVGCSFLTGVRAGSVNDDTIGKILEMYLPPAHHMRIKSGGRGNIIDKYFLTTNPEVYINAANVCRIANFSPLHETDTESLFGLSRLYAARSIIQKFNEGTAAESELLQNKGIREVIFPKNLSDGATVDFDSVRKATDVWNRKINESGHGGILSNNVELGSIKIGFTPEQLGILASQNVTKQDLCALYHVPGNLFGWSEQKTYDNLPESRRIALSDAVMPELETLKDALNGWLIKSHDPSGKLVLDFDYDFFPEMQEDMDKKIKRMRESNCFTVDEIRLAQGYGESGEENGKKIIVSGNCKLLENLGIESYAGDPNAFNEDLSN